MFYWLCECNTIKEILEYNVITHQLKRWTQELLAYEFVIIYQVGTMIKDVDGICRYVDSRVRQFNMTASHLHVEDVTTRLLVYSFNVFIRCTNPRHVTTSDTLSPFITTSPISSISVLYYEPIRLSTVFNINPDIFVSSPVFHPPPRTSLGYPSIQSSIILPHFYSIMGIILFSQFHLRIDLIISPNTSISFTTFQHVIYSL